MAKGAWQDDIRQVAELVVVRNRSNEDRLCIGKLHMNKGQNKTIKCRGATYNPA